MVRDRSLPGERRERDVEGLVLEQLLHEDVLSERRPARRSVHLDAHPVGVDKGLRHHVEVIAVAEVHRPGELEHHRHRPARRYVEEGRVPRASVLGRGGSGDGSSVLGDVHKVERRVDRDRGGVRAGGLAKAVPDDRVGKPSPRPSIGVAWPWTCR